MTLRFVLLLLTALAAAVQGNAQTELVLLRQGKDTIREKFTSLSLAEAALARRLVAAQSEGYLETRFDTVRKAGQLIAREEAGKKHLIGSLTILPDSAMPRLRDFTPRKRDLAVFREGAVEKRVDPILTQLENNGYPFAKLSLENIGQSDSVWHLTYRIHTGALVKLDSLMVRSDDRMPVSYIRRYLGWRPGLPYNEEEMRAMKSRLSEIPFVTVRQAPEIRFRGDEADLYLVLARKPAHTFNGIIGLQPEEGGRTTITGDLEIRLLNAFQGGEEIYFNWRRLQSQTQELHARTRLPYLLGTPFGTEAWVKIYRRDSTFSSFRGQLALVFDLRGYGQMRAFAESNSTSRLSRTISTGDFADVTSTLYGLGLQLMRLDYRFNPRKGWSADIELATGRRTATRQSLANDEPVTLRTNTYRLNGMADWFIPLFKRQTLRLGGKGAALFADGLSENELFRIGGLKTIRGIDEEGIFARSWATGTIEYRFILDKNSALYAYFDQSWYEAQRLSGFVTDTPRGFGAGVFFDTKAGIFSFNYGLARQFDNPLLLRNARLSFGFSSLF